MLISESMFKHIFFAISLCCCSVSLAQYKFSGQIANPQNEKSIYLSIIEDYRKLDRISLEQVVKKTGTDSLGYFNFYGNNLLEENRIYRIHLDDCSETSSLPDHFFGNCKSSKSILFIAKNTDTINFPRSFSDEMLCEIISTNNTSQIFLEIDVLKEQMAFEFNDFRSDASKKLNLQKWFGTLQDFGEQLNEPLAELYIYNFLSDKRNETYTYYIKDIIANNYYKELGERLSTKYPNTVFTAQYKKEIEIDEQIANNNTGSSPLWKWLLPLLLFISVVFNIYLLAMPKINAKKIRQLAYAKLTEQEQNIVKQILQNKTNKEIASTMFISVSTVKTHINNIYKKLEVTTRTEIKQQYH
ncbi:regulatory LuxR family protein [Maribacter sp. MAR_2009_72]|nr:regulatory LuxR family protein [Maribacter sp. MAR_2009_72]